MINFENIEYLLLGNKTQRETYRILSGNKIFEILNTYRPILVGTIPIEINLPDSDADIILQADNLPRLESILTKHFSKFNCFNIKNENDTLVCNFVAEDLQIEIFVQNIPKNRQNGYLHMLKEYEILQSKGNLFRSEIIKLKKNGIKTEPAFCQLLNVKGNSYIELLNYKTN